MAQKPQQARFPHQGDGAEHPGQIGQHPHRHLHALPGSPDEALQRVQPLPPGGQQQKQN